MWQLAVRRLVQAGVVVALVATATFVLLHLAPGDPFTATYESPYVTEELRERWRAAYGLDRPLPEQYVRYLLNVARGDFGYSFSQRLPVRDVLAWAVPNTLVLMGTALVLSFGLGIGLGVLQAMRRRSLLDRTASGVSLLFYSIPDFWLALMALLVLAYWIPLFPVGGITDPILYEYFGFWEKVGDRLHHLVLPATTLALLLAAGIARYQRAAVLDVVHQDFVRTARAKGLDERRIVLRHVLRNALLPTITLAGLYFPALVGGTVFIEKIFSWPGLGLVTVGAIDGRDYPLVMASVIIGSVFVVAGSLLADLLYAAADPRLRKR